MKYFLTTLVIIGSALAFPARDWENYQAISTSTAPPTSTPSTTPATSTPVSSTPATTPATSTPLTSQASSASTSLTASATPTCEVESEGDNGNHYGWCKKAKHSGTYKHGKSDDENL